MRRGLWVLILVAVLGAVPLVALAQSGGEVSGLLTRVQGDLVISPDESADLVVVVNGDVDVQGRAGTVVVVGGTARLLDGEVGRLVVLRGAVDLSGRSRVYGDVWLLGAELRQSPVASIGGSVRSLFGFPVWRFLVEEPLLGVGMLLLVLAAGWAAVAVGTRTMRRAADALTAEFPGALGAALLLFVVVPAAALLLFFSVVGLPLASLYLAVGLPVLALAGFCVSALRVGGWIVRSRPRRPLRAMLLGGTVLTAAAVIPFAGQIIVAAACALGAGALMVAAGGTGTGEVVEIPGGRVG